MKDIEQQAIINRQSSKYTKYDSLKQEMKKENLNLHEKFRILNDVVDLADCIGCQPHNFDFGPGKVQKGNGFCTNCRARQELVDKSRNEYDYGTSFT